MDSDLESRIGDAIATHALIVASYIRELNLSPERERKIARNISAAVLLALEKWP